MAKFRKKPVEIEAIEWTGYNFQKIQALAKQGVMILRVAGSQTLLIPTLEGEMTAQLGDWIIQGVKREVYPCKPEIFHLTYEPVEPPVDPRRTHLDLCATPLYQEPQD